MPSIQNSQNESLNTSGTRLLAFFREKDDAYEAVNQLRNAGFSSAEIGIIEGRNRATGTEAGAGYSTEGNESVWQKIKDFFTGDSHDDVDYDQSVGDMNWDRNRADYYYQGVNEGGALVSVSGPRREEARRILEQAGGDLRESGFESVQQRAGIDSGTDSATDERRIQLRGEILRTYKERVQRGEVTLRKEVVTEHQTLSVPVTREELVIERTSGSGQRADGEIGRDEEIRVPLSEERARVEKQPVVNEEVRVGKRAVQRTEEVGDDVRREELRVDKQGDVDANVPRESKRKKPAA